MLNALILQLNKWIFYNNKYKKNLAIMNEYLFKYLNKII